VLTVYGVDYQGI